ncbi:hypothetical protein GCM10027168_69940 [Streptomyces capparidis]
MLPKDPAWAKDAGCLADRVLSMLASAAEAAEAGGEDRLVLPAVPTAAEPTAPSPRLSVVRVPD